MGLFSEWLYLEGVLDRTPSVEPDFLLQAKITDWPKRFLVKSDDLLFEVTKCGDGQAEQPLQIIVSSSGYPKFLYDNRLDWPSRHLKLPWIHLWLKGRRGRSTLASAIHSAVLDAEALKRDLDWEIVDFYEPYRSPERLHPIGFTHIGEQRIQTYLRTLAEAISDPELAIAAFQPAGLIAENLVAGEAEAVIYLALKTGRKPDAVMACLSGFNISERRAELEEFVKRAHMRMYDRAAAARLPRAPRVRQGWRESVKIAELVRLAVMIFAMLAGWLGGSWSLAALPAGVLLLQSLPAWRQALMLGRHIDANYEPPISFEAGIGLGFALSVLANLLLCMVAFALGHVLASWL